MRASEPEFFWQIALTRNATRWQMNGSALHCRMPRSLFVSCMVALLWREHMSDLVCELIISLDSFARGQRSPAYYGYFGPDFADWIKTNTAIPHRMLIGRRIYEAMEGLPAEVRDEGWQRMTTTPGWLFSRSLEATDWPGLKIVRDDVVDFVRELKRTDGPELRTLGSVSLVRQLLAAGLVDRLKLVVCPLVLPQTGIEPTFE
ncbi:MAG: dihydrofolate reductase family protein, partial [Ktedonobacteraceae bacterium]|nr:dihydrofolate reductase family protein [Ktedonobacteraceae bacterium]